MDKPFPCPTDIIIIPKLKEKGKGKRKIFINEQRKRCGKSVERSVDVLWITEGMWKEIFLFFGKEKFRGRRRGDVDRKFHIVEKESVGFSQTVDNQKNL